MTECKH